MCGAGGFGGLFGPLQVLDPEVGLLVGDGVGAFGLGVEGEVVAVGGEGEGGGFELEVEGEGGGGNIFRVGGW